jgi:hypothetical protein
MLQQGKWVVEILVVQSRSRLDLQIDSDDQR